MSTYTPCTGSFQAAVNTRRINSATLGSKFRHMHGKTYGACTDCARTGLVVRADGTVPAHKPVTRTAHIRQTDEVNITECGLLTEYDVEISPLPLAMASGLDVAIFPDVEWPAQTFPCHACVKAYEGQA